MIQQVHACCRFQFLDQRGKLAVAFQSELKGWAGGEFGAQEADESRCVGGRTAADGFTLDQGDLDALSRQVIGYRAAYDSRADHGDVDFFGHVR